MNFGLRIGRNFFCVNLNGIADVDMFMLSVKMKGRGVTVMT